MKLLKSVVDFIIDSGVWNGVAAFWLSIETYYLINKVLTINTICFYIFFATALIYRIFRRMIVIKDFVLENRTKKFISANKQLISDKTGSLLMTACVILEVGILKK